MSSSLGITGVALDKYLAIDCEMVRTRMGQVPAKVGIVDYAGSVVLESYVYVHPQNVVDWQSAASGIEPGDLDGAPTFEQIQNKVKALLRDKIVVGHAVFNDLAALQHRHPYEDVRDTSLYYPLRKRVGVEREGEYPSLKKLAATVLQVEIQLGAHCPVEDARTAMALFMTVREEYEMGLANGDEVVSGLPRSFEKWYW